MEHNGSSVSVNKFVTCEITEDGKAYPSTLGNNSLISTKKFVNLSTEYILVAFRDGTITTLPPRSEPPYSDNIIIVLRKDNNLDSIRVIPGEEHNNTNIIRNRLAKSKANNLTIEETLKIDVVKNSRSGVYVHSADVVITLVDRISYMSSHPFSIQHAHNMLVQNSMDIEGSTDFGMSIKLISNNGLQSKLYAIVHDRIIIIHPTKSPLFEDGVYITGLVTLDGDSNTLRKNEKFSYAEVLTGKAPIMFYETLAEAKENFNVKKVEEVLEKRLAREHEILINQMKRDREILEQENLKLKAEALKEKERLIELEARKEREFLEYKLEAERKMQEVKDKAAETSAALKTYGDIAKAILATVTLGAALYKVFGKKEK